jgi:hypothetical protein
MDNPICENPGIFHLFIHLLFKANWKENKTLFNGQEMTVKRGQLITGRLALAKELKQKPSTIRNWLQVLKNLQILDIESNSKFSLITIRKYNDYQDKRERKDSKKDSQRTTKGQPEDTLEQSNKETNNSSGESAAQEVREGKTFNPAEYIGSLISNKQRHTHIIGLYWLKRGFKHPNVEAARSAFRRDMRPAKALTGYTDEQILATMDYFDNMPDRDFVWTLETIHKRIDNVIANIK